MMKHSSTFLKCESFILDDGNFDGKKHYILAVFSQGEWFLYLFSVL